MKKELHMLDFLRLTPDTVEMIGQALGIIGMVLIMSSFQFKKLSTLKVFFCKVTHNMADS